MVDLDEREKLVAKEKNRLKRLFKDIPEKRMRAVEGLIIQAARLRVLLDENWSDIAENGDYEHFTQSVQTEPYERERPVARLYNTRDKTYQGIIKQLTEMLPDGKSKEEIKKATASDLI